MAKVFHFNNFSRNSVIEIGENVWQPFFRPEACSLKVFSRVQIFLFPSRAFSTFHFKFPPLSCFSVFFFLSFIFPSLSIAFPSLKSTEVPASKETTARYASIEHGTQPTMRPNTFTHVDTCKHVYSAPKRENVRFLERERWTTQFEEM